MAVTTSLSANTRTRLVGGSLGGFVRLVEVCALGIFVSVLNLVARLRKLVIDGIYLRMPQGANVITSNW
jgi:hypothetical protein